MRTSPSSSLVIKSASKDDEQQLCTVSSLILSRVTYVMLSI